MPKGGHARSGASECADVLYIFCKQIAKGRFDTRRKKGQRDVGVSKSSGTQQPWVFLLKMIILGCFGGTTILGNPHVESIPP